jgi:hypothetical protein
LVLKPLACFPSAVFTPFSANEGARMSLKDLVGVSEICQLL